MSTTEGKKTNKKEKEEQVQNTQILKSGGVGYKRKSW